MINAVGRDIPEEILELRTLLYVQAHWERRITSCMNILKMERLQIFSLQECVAR
jgi:aromatic ring-opening dioxygenase catalytic subunit (LigB family)